MGYSPSCCVLSFDLGSVSACHYSKLRLPLGRNCLLAGLSTRQHTSAAGCGCMCAPSGFQASSQPTLSHTELSDRSNRWLWCAVACSSGSGRPRSLSNDSAPLRLSRCQQRPAMHLRPGLHGQHTCACYGTTRNFMPTSAIATQYTAVSFARRGRVMRSLSVHQDTFVRSHRINTAFSRSQSSPGT